MRGQQASALEHATPEAFWIDRTQCRYIDENGQTVNPTRPDCPQAVSAVKAIAIAASQGQKIYTLTQKNAAVALPQLSVSRTVAAEIRNAIAAGKEVTVHEKAINAHGFSGVGYIIIDPDTGSGAYLIEGGGSGGLAFAFGIIIGALLIINLEFIAKNPASLLVMAPYIGLIASILLSVIFLFNDFNRSCFFGGFALALLIAAIGSEYLPATKVVSTVSNIMGLLSLLFVPFATSPLQACIS